MRFTSRTSCDGVTEELFTLGEIPGVLWTPEGTTGTRPLIVMGHGGGQHKKAPGVVTHAHHFVTAGRVRPMRGPATADSDVPRRASYSWREPRTSTQVHESGRRLGGALPRHVMQPHPARSAGSRQERPWTAGGDHPVPSPGVHRRQGDHGQNQPGATCTGAPIRSTWRHPRLDRGLHGGSAQQMPVAPDAPRLAASHVAQ